jgi:hypothetical protein
MSESIGDGTQLIPEARRFEQRMARIIDAGDAATWHGAEEILIANEVAPPVPKSQHAEYIDERPLLSKQVSSLDGRIADRRATVIAAHRLDIARRAADFGAAGTLSATYAMVTPGVESRLVYNEGLVASISQCLDDGVPVSIYGFSRQGKTSLAYAVTEARQQSRIYSDGQTAEMYLGTVARAASPMAAATNASNEDLRLVLDPLRSADDIAKTWSTLNQYAEQNDERILVVLDEIGVFTTGKAAGHSESLKREIEEIIGLDRLDLIVIEHVIEGRCAGEIIDILPTSSRQFAVPPVTGPETFDFLRSHTAKSRVSYTPEAAAEIHSLAGGWLSLSALIGKNVILHALKRQDRARFIFEASDVETWVKDYVQEPKDYRNDYLVGSLLGLVSNLSPTQRAVVDDIAQSAEGIDVSLIDSSDLLVRTGVVTLNHEAGRAYLASKLLQRLLPEIHGRIKFLDAVGTEGLE